MLGKTDCRRFEGLLERETQDLAPLDPEEEVFLERHRLACPACDLSVQLIDEMGRIGREVPGSHPGDAALELKARQVLARGDRPGGEPVRRGWQWAGAAALAAAAAVLAALLLHPGQKPAPGDDVGPPLAGATLIEVSGSASFTDRTAAVGDVLRSGDTLDVDSGSLFVEFADGSTAFVEERTRLSLLATTDEVTRLRLDRGRVALHVAPQQVGERFTIDTSGGRIRVLGTVFAVDAREDGHEVAVTEGLVQFTLSEGPVVEIPAGFAFHTSTGLRELPADESAAIQRMAVLGEPAYHAESATERTEAAIRVTEPAEADVEPQTASPSRGSEEDPPSVETLLAEARQCRVRRDWSGAVEAYQGLIATHPDSPEAVTSLVPMGRIQLEQLDQPEVALRSFALYIERAEHGSLLEEAEWGVAEAYRRLGRSEEETQALQRFREHHPDSLYAGPADGRLQALKKK